MTPDFPNIPYGVADFKRIRREGMLYVDKTRFIRSLERHRYVLLIRPRRFGKTLWVSVLENYYDRGAAGDFEATFKGTDIGTRPTALRNRYVVLRFNFSVIRSDSKTLPFRFEEYCRDIIKDAVQAHCDVFPAEIAQHIEGASDTNAALNRLFLHAGRVGVPLFVLIDEYDNFANTVLADDGEAVYQRFTRGDGFFRSFFAALKAGTERGAIQRMFITGVSPVTLDDVTSGFNIADNISMDLSVSEMVGFTETEARGLLELYAKYGVFKEAVDTALNTMREWYDGYRFSEAATSTVYNSDMVLYYLRRSINNGCPPRRLIDNNVRIDYWKLRHLMVLSRQGAIRFNGNFDVLREVVAKGWADAELNTSFLLERLTDRDNFLSLLYFFGLLTIKSAGPDDVRLQVPNQTVWSLMYEYIREAYREGRIFDFDAGKLRATVRRMVSVGEWRPLMEYFQRQIAEQSGIRTLMQGEAHVRGFLLAYLGLTQHFLIRSELELGEGYADIVLMPRTERHSDLRFGYVMELKYLKRGELPTKDRAAGGLGARGGNSVAKGEGEHSQDDAPPAVRRKLAQARNQLRDYLGAAELRARQPTVHFTGVALVFHGWELIACEEVMPPS